MERFKFLKIVAATFLLAWLGNLPCRPNPAAADGATFDFRDSALCRRAET